jgi:hypothetical protein
MAIVRLARAWLNWGLLRTFFNSVRLSSRDNEALASSTAEADGSNFPSTESVEPLARTITVGGRRLINASVNSSGAESTIGIVMEVGSRWLR